MSNYVKNQPDVYAVILFVILKFLVSTDINCVVCVDMININVIYHLEIFEHK